MEKWNFILTFLFKKCKDDLNFVVLSAYVLGNCLAPDQVQHNFGSDLDPNCLAVWWFSKYILFLRNAYFEELTYASSG